MTEADIARISSAARRCCGNLGCPPPDLDDAVQEVLIQYLKRQNKGKAINLRLACLRALRQMDDTRNTRRKAFRERFTSLPSDLADSTSDDPAEIAELREERGRFLARLTEAQREVLSLYRKRWTAQQIARRLGYSYQAVFRFLREIDDKWVEKKLAES